MELYETMSAVAIFNRYKSVHVNTLCEIFYSDVKISSFYLLKFLKFVSKKNHTLRKGIPVSIPSQMQTNKQTNPPQTPIEIISPMLILLKIHKCVRDYVKQPTF